MRQQIRSETEENGWNSNNFGMSSHFRGFEESVAFDESELSIKSDMAGIVCVVIESTTGCKGTRILS